MRSSKLLALALALLCWLPFTPATAQIITPVQMGNANLTSSNVQNLITTLNTFTAPRTLTIPSRSSLNSYYLQFADTANAVNGANTLTINVSDGSLINGAASLVLTQPGAYVMFVPSSTGYLASIVNLNNPPSGAAGGDLTGTYPNPTLAAIGSATGPLGSATVSPIVTIDTKGRVTALGSATITPAIGSVTGLGAGCATWLGTPSSANLRGCLTDESGTGAAYFQGGDIGTPSAGVGTNLTSLNAGNISSGNLAVARLNGGTGASATTFWRGDGTWASIESTSPTTFTPTDASGAGLSFTSVTGIYAKYNRMIIIQFRLTFPSTANGANVAIGSLPFASLSTGAVFAPGSCQSGGTNFFVASPFMSANATTINIFGTAGAVATNANLSTAILTCTLTYITN